MRLHSFPTRRSSDLHLVLDRAEVRLAAVLEAVSHGGGELALVKLKPVDLEEIYREITH